VAQVTEKIDTNRYKINECVRVLPTSAWITCTKA